MVIRSSRRHRIELLLEALDGVVEPSSLKGFSGKLVVQKVAYILQEVFGVDLGVKFVWHSYGPYSYEIARDYKILHNLYSTRSDNKSAVLDVEGLVKFKKFLSKVKEKLVDNDNELGYWLEIIASLYMLSKKIYPPPEDLIDELLERKPYVSRHDAIRALGFLREEGLI